MPSPVAIVPSPHPQEHGESLEPAGTETAGP